MAVCSDTYIRALLAVANEGATPDAIRAALLQGLWEIRTLWQNDASDVLPRPIEVLPDAVGAHVDVAKWIVRQDLDAAARGMLAARHGVTASRLGASVGHPEWLYQSITDLRGAQAALLADAPHWALPLVAVEAGLAVSRGRRRQDLVPDDIDKDPTGAGERGSDPAEVTGQ